ncbi:hypothetical protein F2Q69_00036136 [Brassica cretica]|uniref:Uncharacterized protein n=1 Tax=Brassica cretica TaxID=69181 RepID=A0A8S9SIC9_BRACR|nr:hypothetical protein F2Q69_00036136 [Brassica cretica]
MCSIPPLCFGFNLQQGMLVFDFTNNYIKNGKDLRLPESGKLFATDRRLVEDEFQCIWRRLVVLWMGIWWMRDWRSVDMIVVDMRYVDNSSVDSKQQHELRGVAWIGDWRSVDMIVVDMRYVDNNSVDSKQQHELRGVAWIGDW